MLCIAFVLFAKGQMLIMKIHISFIKNQKCTQYIFEFTLAAHAQFTLPTHFGTISQSHVFSLSFALVFLFFSYFVFAYNFFISHPVKHKEKNI